VSGFCKNLVILSALITLIIFKTTGLYGQSIEWTRVYHDDYGRPLYTGGTSYSSPTFVDIDGDGDYDYFQGCKDGTIWFFKNVGTPDSAAWHYVTDKYNDIYFDYLEYSNVTFSDIDADGDLDMFIGGKLVYSTKGIHFYENVGDSINASWNFISDCYMGIDYHNNSGTSYYCHAQFLDFNNDNDFDLFFINSGLWITYYENIGTDTTAVFSLITDNLLNSGYGNGYAILLEIEDLDKDNDYDIFTGSAFYRNEGTPDSAFWQLEDYNYYDLDCSLGLELNDIDNDNDFDMFVGMHDGKVYHYENITTANEPVWQFNTYNPITIDVGVYSYSSFCDIDGDGLPEMFMVDNEDPDGIKKQSINYYENNGLPGQPFWELDTTSYFNIRYPSISAPAFGDIDNDGDYDMFFGQFESGIVYHENSGDSFNPQFDSTGTILFNIPTDETWCFHPTLVDIDADSDLDMFIGATITTTALQPSFHFYRNDGTTELPVWTYVFSNWLAWGKVAFLDVDGDVDNDMFCGGPGDDIWGDIFFFRNTGDSSSFNFVLETEHYDSIRVGHGMSLFFYDITNDGNQDLIIGEQDGGINLFRNDGIVGIRRANNTYKYMNSFKLYQNYPNPFNNTTKVTFYIPQKSNVEIIIFNTIGQKVKVLVQSQLFEGDYEVIWDGTDGENNNVASGLYYCVLKTENTQQLIKLLLIK